MKNYIEKLPKDLRELIDLAADVAQDKGYKAYLVGGFVRDLLLGVKNLDLDIAVEGSGISFAQEYARRLKAKLVTHHRFGTATVSPGHKLKVDVSSARKESYPAPGSLPVVEKGSLWDDLKRRDFTINAMAIEISKDKAGDLVDYFNGKKDLADRKLRVLHDASFIDDPTRILRGIRFEQRHNFVFEPNTMHLLKDAVRLSLIEKVEPQRLRDELICMFKEDKPLNIVNRMDELTGLKFISPSVKMPDSVRRLFLSLEHWAGWFRQHNPGERALDLWLLYFMGLLMPLSGHEVSGICRRFVLRKGEEKRIVSGIETCSRLIQALGQKTVRPSAIYHMLAPLSYEVIILLLAQSESTVATERIKGFLKESSGAKISVSGHDLGAWGLEPGPAYQKIFKAVLNAKLDGKLKSKEEELHLARMIAAAYKRSKARQQHP